MRRRVPQLVVVLAAASSVVCAAPTPAAAFNPVKPICSAAGVISGIAGKACSVAGHAGRLVSAGKKLATGHVGGAVKTVLGAGSSAGSAATTAIGLAAIGAWVLGGAKFALHETAKVLASTSRPQLDSTWFSSTYWQMAGIAALLTLPFLFAAAVQAVLRSDLALLARAALGYLPLALLAVSVAAPLTMLLLAASDEMAAIVSSAAGNAGAHFLDRASLTIGGLTLVSGSPFLAFLVGLLTAAGTIVLWLELLMREAAVYVIVLMLPLVFAALVWPARRVWAVRAVEVLVALILSKFAIVAVLALGGAAMSHTAANSVTGFLAGIVLVMLGAFAPWALLRLMPMSELASATAGSLRSEGRAVRGPALVADDGAHWAHDWSRGVTARMRRQAQETSDSAPRHDAIAALSSGEPSSPTRAAARDADDGATRRPSQAGQFDSAGPGARAADGTAPNVGSPASAGTPASADGTAPNVGSPASAGTPAPGAGAGAGATPNAGGDGSGAPNAGDVGGDTTGVDGSAGGPANPGGVGATSGAGAGAGERSPGMGPMWQAPDMTLEALGLDPDHGGPPTTPWGQGGSPSAGSDDAGEPAPGSDRPRTADDRDLLPPAQEQPEGRL
jgi:hypothetical protein